MKPVPMDLRKGWRQKCKTPSLYAKNEKNIACEAKGAKRKICR